MMDLRQLPFRVNTQADDVRLETSDGDIFTPEQLYTELFKFIKTKIDQRLADTGDILDKVVVTVPAMMNSGARQATEQAAVKAGLRRK